MTRVCFQLQVKPDLLPEYRLAHAAVWPEMLRAIADSGRRNYSLFLRDDGLLIGYYETDSVEASQAALAADPRTHAWEAAMADYFVALDGRPDQNALTLTEIFNLDDQLAKDTREPHLRPDRPAARGPGHRAAVVGVRQLRHPV